MYVILDVDVGGSHYYYFHPSWSQSVDFDRRTLQAGHDEEIEILSFTWPCDAGSGAAGFWGAACTAFSYDVLDVDYTDFSWF